MNCFDSFRTVCGLATIVLSTVATATAAQAATRDEQSSACRSDALRFCLADVPNEAKITACMKKNVERLSPDCRLMFGHDNQPDKPSTSPKASTAG